MNKITPESLENFNRFAEQWNGSGYPVAKITPESLAGNSEHSHQTALFCWAVEFAKFYPLIRYMFAIPNGGERNIAVAAKLKAEGVKRGVPDIFLPVAIIPYHGLFIEMKRIGGAISPQQDEYHAYLRKAGYKVVVCHGWRAARDQIKYYIGLDREGSGD